MFSCQMFTMLWENGKM
uniref:Uncharacterized protein n=1 Tax=Rhizophora mucronata TaxID=61149 RepID=A0A2P2QB22_RHIMU